MFLEQELLLGAGVQGMEQQCPLPVVLCCSCRAWQSLLAGFGGAGWVAQVRNKIANTNRVKASSPFGGV